MNPIIVGSPLQRLSWIDGLVQIYLFLSVVKCKVDCGFSLDALLFALLFGLLPVGRFWRLHEILFGEMMRTKQADIILEISVLIPR